MNLRVYGEEVTLTPETIDKTWQWYIDNAIGCINEVLFEGVRVNDTVAYIEWKLNQIKMYQNRTCDIWLGFIQQAYYIQTGESVPILSK